jgi:MFS family permease
VKAAYLSVLSAAICCYAALGAVVRVVPSYVGGTLGHGSVAVGVAVGAPALTAVVSRPLSGREADRRGTRLVVITGAVVMALGALPMFIPDLGAFLASRLVVGAGEGAMMSASVLWLLRLAGPERRGRALGHIGLANYVGLTVGPLLADALGTGGHPTRVFWAAAVLPLLPLPLVVRLPEGAGDSRDRAPLRAVLRIVLGPGAGLLLVNIGYAALLAFGSAAVADAKVLVLPLYAVTVIAVRTLAAGVPDHLGGRRMLILAAPTAALGLLIVATAPALPPALAGVIVLGIGQGFAVPALGLLALERVPEEQQGAASGAFFAWFDLGVAIGGPLAGTAAAVGGGDAALTVAAAAVGCAAPVALRLRRVTAA